MPCKDLAQRQAYKKAYDKARYVTNATAAKAHARARYLANPSATKSRNARWYVANREKRKAQARAWQVAHPDRHRMHVRRWYEIRGWKIQRLRDLTKQYRILTAQLENLNNV